MSVEEGDRHATEIEPVPSRSRRHEGADELEKYVRNSGIEQSLIELVKTRASQINGCAYCIYMHTRDARARGETEERLYLLDARHESPLYTECERAALAWTEAVTLVSQTG